MAASGALWGCLFLWSTGGSFSGAQARDWLIDPSPYRAQEKLSADGNELEIDNGLIRRRFRLGPNAATVGLDHRVTGESLLRGVKPEALITLDGQEMAVGGLVGQPNYAFLQPDWEQGLRADPAAFRFVGHAVGPIKPRMEWKRVRHHAPGMVWPPSGIHLRLDFGMPEAAAAPGTASDVGRLTLWEDTFDTIHPEWRTVRSAHDPRIQFHNEGKPGEIYALSGTHCYAERALPEDAAVVEAVIFPGTDTDTSWGPGMALVYPDRVVGVNLRPGDRGVHGAFELRNGGVEQLAHVAGLLEDDGGLDRSRSYRIRVRLDAGNSVWEVSDAALQPPQFHRLFEVPARDTLPLAVRVGKTDRRGQGSDEVPADAAWVRSHISAVRVYGAYDAARDPFQQGDQERDYRVSVHYELYDGLPAYAKWITVTNLSREPVRLNRYSSEVLAVVERVSEVDDLSEGTLPPNLHVETDMAFGGMLAAGANRRAFRWLPDPDYHTQVNYRRLTPCLLDVGPDLGPDQVISPGESWTSYRAWILVPDTTERERRGLAVRRLYRTVAPWVTENPLMMHVISSNGQVVTNAINQCAEVGFEMVILSFGSGFNVEDTSAANLEKARQWAGHARAKGVELGTYSLLASRSIGPDTDVVMPPGRTPIFGHSPCLESVWGNRYFDQLYRFYADSGFTLLEHDGSYPGDICASTEHPGHRGLEDSTWNQWRRIADFYRWSRGEGIYLNVPDHYFLAGSSKTGMGYREVNWSLPRAQQVIHTRQNIYDGTWEKIPSMGWMFVPLTEYHGGGAAATIEPLDQHLDHYERMLDSNLALGVQACYRGPRLYDTERTREMVRRKVDWYKTYREVLESDLIHGRRADARDLDWMLHVNPGGVHKGMLVVFNPLPVPVQRTLKVNLYYTGLTESARIRDRGGEPVEYALERDHSVDIPIEVGSQSMAWLVVE